MSKNDDIRKSIRETRDRHAGMVCRVFELKVVRSKLSRAKRDMLDTYFREAKWLRNAVIGSGNPHAFDRCPSKVPVKVGDAFEERELTLLGSQVKQDIVDGVRSELKGLATKKRKGYKVGELKFKSYCNSIPLRQYGKTYVIDFEKSTVGIQNMRKFPLKVRGLQQIPEGAEIANARLVRKPSGIYVHVTTYTQPGERIVTHHVCGLDFGIGHALTDDEGRTWDVQVDVSKGTRLASRRVSRARVKHDRLRGIDRGKEPKAPRSRRDAKRLAKRRRAYERDNNRKRDLANKVVSQIVQENDFIAMQDEMLKGWQAGLFGKQVQMSALGTIKAKLKTNSKTHVVDRSFPSTQICPSCGRCTKHPLWKRDYDCQYCGYHHASRDAKAASSNLQIALDVSLERRTKSPAEDAPSTESRCGLKAGSSFRRQGVSEHGHGATVRKALTRDTTGSLQREVLGVEAQGFSLG